MHGRDCIHGDRRADRRYTLTLGLRYRSPGNREAAQEQEGNTLDISAGGVLFSSRGPLPIGSAVELSIDWPVLLHGTKRIRLKVYGRVMRSDERATALRTIRHEFFTAGQPAVQAPDRAAHEKYNWPAGALLQ